MKTFANLAELAACVGQDVTATEWVTITQQQVNQFAEATGDHQWIHVDPERAARELPYGGTVAHEFGHAIGLAHEHQNPAGGMQWNEAAVIRDLSGPPNHWGEAQIRHNVLNKYRADQINGTTSDPDSVMLYFFVIWQKLAQLHIPVTFIANAIQSEVANIPGGSVNAGSKSFNIKTSGNYQPN